MGSKLRAICYQCKFEDEVYFGGGMRNFMEECDVPAINTKTGKFVVANIFNKKKLDKDLVFYNDKKMYKGKLDKSSAHEWGDIYLSYDNNLCPGCKNYSMKFELELLFD